MRRDAAMTRPGYVKIAIENDDWNSGFTHKKHGDFP